MPDEEAFYSSLDMEDITSMDYEHAKRVYKEFKLQNLADYQDLYVKSDTLLLADVFEYLRDKCIEIYELDPAHVLKGVKLELLTDTDTLLMVEKGIRGAIYQAIHRYTKANNKYMKSCGKNIE